MSFEALLFDCDGVLVDSEAITCGVLRDMLEEKGWQLTLADCMAHFVGHTVRNRAQLIFEHTGWRLSDDWLEQFYQRRNERLASQIRAVEGVASDRVRAHRAADQVERFAGDHFRADDSVQILGQRRVRIGICQR